jgi:hypothetical protein
VSNVCKTLQEERKKKSASCGRNLKPSEKSKTKKPKGLRKEVPGKGER